MDPCDGLLVSFRMNFCLSGGVLSFCLSAVLKFCLSGVLKLCLSGVLINFGFIITSRRLSGVFVVVGSGRRLIDNCGGIEAVVRGGYLAGSYRDVLKLELRLIARDGAFEGSRVDDC